MIAATVLAISRELVGFHHLVEANYFWARAEVPQEEAAREALYRDALAAYDRSDRELRVQEVAIDTSSDCAPTQIADGLLDALELGCVAGSVRRLVLPPRTGVFDDVLQRRGYTAIAQVATGTWYEKRFA